MLQKLVDIDSSIIRQVIRSDSKKPGKLTSSLLSSHDTHEFLCRKEHL